MSYIPKRTRIPGGKRLMSRRWYSEDTEATAASVILGEQSPAARFSAMAWAARQPRFSQSPPSYPTPAPTA